MVDRVPVVVRRDLANVSICECFDFSPFCSQAIYTATAVPVVVRRVLAINWFLQSFSAFLSIYILLGRTEMRTRERKEYSRYEQSREMIEQELRPVDGEQRHCIYLRRIIIIDNQLSRNSN